MRETRNIEVHQATAGDVIARVYVCTAGDEPPVYRIMLGAKMGAMGGTYQSPVTFEPRMLDDLKIVIENAKQWVSDHPLQTKHTDALQARSDTAQRGQQV